MPWKEQNHMSLKEEFVIQALKKEISMTTLCKRYEISRKTGYKWLKRYQAEGKEGLKLLNRRPLSSPKATAKLMVKEIISIRKKHPCWGGRKIKAILTRAGKEDVPAASAISNILKRNGYIEKEKSIRKFYTRFEHAAPNHLWQMDFKGDFGYEQGRCYPLTIVDDHSRFAIGLKACRNQQRKTVQRHLIELFERYGLPQRINVDNGNPWGSLFECARYTSFSVWLIKVGVAISYSRPGHPQTNGKDERFHRTLKEELIKPSYFRNLSHIQKRFDEWKQIYNYERPHEGIGMQVPGERYQVSYRSYQGEKKEADYSPDYDVRIIDSRGRIHLEGRQIFVGVPFAKEQIGIRHTEKKDVREIYFMHQKLGRIDLNLIPKKSIINLYSQKITEL